MLKDIVFIPMTAAMFFFGDLILIISLLSAIGFTTYSLFLIKDDFSQNFNYFEKSAVTLLFNTLGLIAINNTIQTNSEVNIGLLFKFNYSAAVAILIISWGLLIITISIGLAKNKINVKQLWSNNTQIIGMTISLIILTAIAFSAYYPAIKQNEITFKDIRLSLGPELTGAVITFLIFYIFMERQDNKQRKKEIENLHEKIDKLYSLIEKNS